MTNEVGGAITDTKRSRAGQRYVGVGERFRIASRTRTHALIGNDAIGSKTVLPGQGLTRN
jgi:hypothetical protein